MLMTACRLFCCPRGLLVGGTTVRTGSLELGFVLCRGNGGQTLARTPVGIRIQVIAHFTDPASPLVTVEVTVAVVRERGIGAVLEPDQGGIGAFGRAQRIPATDACAQARGTRAREHSHDIDLVRSLAEDGTTAFGRHQFFGPARTIQVIGVVESLDHLHRTEIARAD
ncbi:hypothetical protein SDC9_181509 [bioreactor metagenome]|uniref:Uncharacterized protein n=1 Tax=bioreactor metagenome TaxID=1076179 RepID=A0A645H4S7_9ZZZZ